MRYTVPSLNKPSASMHLIAGASGNKNNSQCPDGGEIKSSGAYEVDE